MKDTKVIPQSKVEELVKIVDNFSRLEKETKYDRLTDPKVINFLANAHTIFELAQKEYDSAESKFFAKYVERVEALVEIYFPGVLGK